MACFDSQVIQLFQLFGCKIWVLKTWIYDLPLCYMDKVMYLFDCPLSIENYYCFSLPAYTVVLCVTFSATSASHFLTHFGGGGPRLFVFCLDPLGASAGFHLWIASGNIFCFQQSGQLLILLISEILIYWFVFASYPIAQFPMYSPCIL